MQFVLVLLLWLNGSSHLENAHDFHLSRTTVNYDSEEQAIQISTSIFIDDLELSLQGWGHDSLKICTHKEKEEAESLMHKYLSQHLTLEVNGKKLTTEFLGKEPSDDLMAVWCYLEIYDVAPFEEISITNTILTELFDDQKNITMLQLDKERVAHILFTTDKTSENVEY